MVGSSITNSRFTYLHDCKWPCEAVDVHHIIVKKRGANGFFVYAFAFIILATTFYLFLVKEKSVIFVLWSILLNAILVKLLQKRVEKGENPSDGPFGRLNWYFLCAFVFLLQLEEESVVVMPAFGVQLETHYVSGKITRRFVPMDKILKPVLLECVTPVTCYWSLSFIVHGEEELVLVFKELRPPMKMLVPIWKALCDATGT